MTIYIILSNNMLPISPFSLVIGVIPALYLQFSLLVKPRTHLFKVLKEYTLLIYLYDPYILSVGVLQLMAKTDVILKWSNRLHLWLLFLHISLTVVVQ